MDTEDQEYLKNIENRLENLRAEKLRIENEIKRLCKEKERIEYDQRLAKAKKKTDITELVETTYHWSATATKLLTETFKFKEFRPQQLAAINATLHKMDVLLVMPTGGGKSLVYQLPALIDKHLTLVVSPLISLIEDQLLALRNLGIGAATINGNSTREEKNLVHTEMLNKDTKINLLYVTPEWVAKSKVFMTYLQKCFSKGYLDRIVIDEVHCCSTWGHDFRPEYNHLGFFKLMFNGVPFLGLTATATMKVLLDIQSMLNLQDSLIITAPFNRPNLLYKIINKPSDKTECLDILERLLKNKYKNQSGIIYTATVKETEEVMKGLLERYVNVRCYHAQLEPSTKKKVHEQWLKNKVQAIVATIAFGMGIDKPDVRFVIHHCVPKSMEGFYQESGRAGRDGKRSDCILMFNMSDFLRNVSMASSRQEEKNAMSILEYSLDQKRCRRELIAKYFDDNWEEKDCQKMCDHCRKPKEIAYYDVGPALKDIVRLIEAAHLKEVKMTLNKLVSAWFQTGTKELRLAVKKPSCSKEAAEHIVGFLIFKGYLKIDKGYTMYTTVAYIQKGQPEAAEIEMPYGSNLGYRKVKKNPDSNQDLNGPLPKKVRLDS